MGKKKLKKRKKKKTNYSLVLSIIAIVISLGQLIFTMPFVIKQFEEVEMLAIELGMAKHPNEKYLESSFVILNTGKNTAKDVEFHLRTFNGDKIMIVPDVFELIKSSDKTAPVLNSIYRCKQVVPQEKIMIYVMTDFKKYLNFYKLDTLYYGKSNPLPRYIYGPNIISLKHSLGKVIINRQDSLRLKKLEYN